MVSTLDLAIRDAKGYTNNGGFETELSITPIDLPQVVIKGLGTKHSESFDGQGMPIVGVNAHCSFNESDLNDLGIVTRDSRGQIIIKGWLVGWTDNIETVSYKISSPEPDETLGTIRCTLGLHE